MRELPSCAPELFSLSIITRSPACHYRWLEARQAGKLVSPMECICLWAMDGFSLHQVQSRNAPATAQNDAVRAHKTWWMLVFCQSRCQGDVVWSELLVAFLWHFRACFSAVHEMLLDQSCYRGTWLTTLESYLIKHCKTTLEVKTSLPLLPSLALTCLHMIIVIVSLRHSS